jgi:hypothetical protein
MGILEGLMKGLSQSLNGFQIGGVPILFSGNISKSKVALELQSWEQKTK